MKKRITIYINGVRATMEDLSVLLKDHLDEIIDRKTLPNGNISITTI